MSKRRTKEGRAAVTGDVGTITWINVLSEWAGATPAQKGDQKNPGPQIGNRRHRRSPRGHRSQKSRHCTSVKAGRPKVDAARGLHIGRATMSQSLSQVARHKRHGREPNGGKWGRARERPMCATLASFLCGVVCLPWRPFCDIFVTFGAIPCCDHVRPLLRPVLTFCLLCLFGSCAIPVVPYFWPVSCPFVT